MYPGCFCVISCQHHLPVLIHAGFCSPGLLSPPSWCAGIGAGYSPVTIAALVAAVTIVVTYTAPKTDEQAAGGKPVPDDVLATDYDADFVAAYWARRPGAVAVRSMQVLAAAARVGSGLLLDSLQNRCAL